MYNPKKPIHVKVLEFINTYEGEVHWPYQITDDDKKALVIPVIKCVNKAFLDHFRQISKDAHVNLITEVEQETGVIQEEE